MNARDYTARRALLHCADRFAVVEPAPGREPVEIVNRRSLDPSNLATWAISRGSFVLNSDFQWELEANPSARTPEFIAGTRFTLADALDHWERYQEMQ